MIEVNKKYNVIYADPPWKYGKTAAGRKGKGAVKHQYSTLTISDIELMPIKDMVEDNSLIFIWTTTPMMQEGLSVLKAWGFEYKTSIFWEKTGGLGMGSWVRIQIEILLVGVRGYVKPFNHQEKNIYRHPICKHSAKPHFFRELIMKLASKSFDNCERLELFARSRSGMFSDYEYDGWDIFGNEANNSIKMNEAG